MTAFTDGKIKAYLGPTELGAPGRSRDGDHRVHPGRSKKSLDIAVQEIDNPKIAQAVLDARWGGVDVDLFLEQGYLRSSLQGQPPKPPKPGRGETSEQAPYRVRGWMTIRSSPRTVASSPPCCARMSRCVGCSRRGCSIRNSPCATTGAARQRPRPRCSAARRTSRSPTCTATSNHVVVFDSAYVCRQYGARRNRPHRRRGRLLHAGSRRALAWPQLPGLGGCRHRVPAPLVYFGLSSGRRPNRA